MREEISKFQRKLRLSSSLTNIYPKIKAKSHEELLLKLLKVLNRDREEKRKVSNLRNVGFQVLISLEGYDCSQDRFLDSLSIHELNYYHL